MTWQLHSGSGAPGTIAGQTSGDNYIDYTTGDLYQLVGSSWSKIATWPKTSEAMLSLSDVTTGDADGTKHGLMPKLFGGVASITSAVAIANTETVVVTKTLPANTMKAGTTFRISFSGIGTTGSTPGTGEFKIRIGSTTLSGNIPASYNVANVASKTGYPFKGEALITVRSAGESGTATGSIAVFADDYFKLFTYLTSIGTGSLVAVDTTAEKIIELTYKSGNAGTTLTFSTALIEIVKL